MSKRAAIYTRISNDNEGKAFGVARQEKDCRALAEREGFAVVGVYSDNDVSASTNSRTPRPDYLRMLDDAEAGRFEVILTYSTSRLTRKPREIEDIIDLHESHGTELVTVASGRPDLYTADGRLNTRLLGNVDTSEAERTAERVRRKQKELAEAGRHNGPRPYGWNIVGTRADQKLVINEIEAAILRECIDNLLRGDGIRTICLDLNKRGVKTGTGGEWQTQVLRRMLLRPRNYGMRSHTPKGKKPQKPQLYKGQWDPIVDQDTHERVVALLTDPARRTNNRGTAPKYLLTSVALCGACGRPVVGTSEFTYVLKNGRTRFYPNSYKCPYAGCMKVQRRMADVDEHVERVVLGVLEREGVSLLGGDPLVVEQARERALVLEAKLALAADQFADDVITGEQLQRITGKLRPQLDAERARLAQAQPAPDVAAYTGPGAAGAWAKADIETQKRILRALGMQITIQRVGAGNGRAYDPDSVTITWG